MEERRPGGQKSAGDAVKPVGQDVTCEGAGTADDAEMRGSRHDLVWRDEGSPGY